jgi:acetate kinase
MMGKAINILALNSGSSSLKFGLYRVGPGEVHSVVSQSISATDPDKSIEHIGRTLSALQLPQPDAIGHRIVHGGPLLRQHCRIDAEVLHQLQVATPFAPVHLPISLALIGAAQSRFPNVPQVACFDTQFHSGLPEVARVLPIAQELRSEGIERYGFHGLSLESIVRQLGAALPLRLVVAHLGSGASITALKGGKSVDTSMGMTPSGGVIMGTRSGELDPGLIMYLLREKRIDAELLEVLLDHHSGLLGISGVSSDMRRLHDLAPSNRAAALAIEMFCCSVKKQIAAMTAVLGGVDMLVFTGGIGENDPQVRNAVCSGLSWIGVSPFVVRVLASQEQEQIARHTWALASPVLANE